MATDWLNDFDERLDTKQADPPPRYDDIHDHAHIYLNGKYKEKSYPIQHKPSNGNPNNITHVRNTKQQLHKLQGLNAELQSKLERSEKENTALERKIESLKIKLATTNSNVIRFNEERDKIKTNLNASQIDVARLEERLLASISELDRLRTPANPDSNMNIKKHIVNVKKEIKKLRTELENERNKLKEDTLTMVKKNEESYGLEQELKEINEELENRVQEREEVHQEEIEEERKKVETLREIEALKQEQKTYGQKVKIARVQLGVKRAGKNVNIKLSHEMKATEKTLLKQLNTLEKKLKDAVGELDVLRNRHRMSKTAQSINTYTNRNRGKRDGVGKVSFADSGIGNVKFTSSKDKTAAKNTNTTHTPKFTKYIEEKAGKRNGKIKPMDEQLKPKLKDKGDGTANGKLTEENKLDKMSSGNRTSRSEQLRNPQKDVKASGKVLSTNCVPPPKPKLK